MILQQADRDKPALPAMVYVVNVRPVTTGTSLDQT
jgi:hypothetical protein